MMREPRQLRGFFVSAGVKFLPEFYFITLLIRNTLDLFSATGRHRFGSAAE